VPEPSPSLSPLALGKGSDLLVAKILRSDPFLVDGFLSDGERSVALDYWRSRRFPEERARFQQLESDMEKISSTGRILENYQRLTHNTSIANGVPPMSNPRGAVGPMPRDRSHSTSLVERARHMTQVLAAGR
jgi:hypothetical protein